MDERQYLDATDQNDQFSPERRLPRSELAPLTRESLEEHDLALVDQYSYS